jgi:AbiV family abortive infection protein
MNMPTTHDTTIVERNINHELSEISRGVSKAFDNARELFQEAAILLSHGPSAVPYSFTRSPWKCGKIDILGAAAVNLISGRDTDLKKIAVVITRHKAKNFANSYLLPLTAEEQAATEFGDWKSAVRAFKEHQAEFHLYPNTFKKFSLYVDFTGNQFLAPKEVVTEEMVETLAALNSRFLEFSEPKSKCWFAGSVIWAKSGRWSSGSSSGPRSLKSQADMDPRQAISVLMEEMMVRTESSGYAGIALELTYILRLSRVKA